MRTGVFRQGLGGWVGVRGFRMGFLPCMEYKNDLLLY